MAPLASSGSIGVLETPHQKYYLSEKIGDGDIARVYRAGSNGNSSSSMVAIKVPKTEGDNPLILHEQGILSTIKHEFLPSISDRLELQDGRIASVFQAIDGLDLQELRRRPSHRRGVTPHFHVGWFLERVLSVLGELHSKMVVHGNLQPKHLLVTAQKHKVTLIDFCWARQNPTQFDRIQIFTDHYSAPEIKQNTPPLPGMDIYSLGKCAVYWLGGKPQTGEIPHSVDARIREFIEEMIEPNYLKRPRDAWDLAHRILKLRREVYGPARWVDLEV